MTKSKNGWSYVYVVPVCFYDAERAKFTSFWVLALI